VRAAVITCIFRLATLGFALLLLPAFTDAQLENARQAAHFFKEKYWECLAGEIVQTFQTSMSAQDFSLYTPIPSVSEKWLARAGGNDSCCGHDSRRLS
jgi:hypothetical protein